MASDMLYALMPYPHANRRYAHSVRALLECELSIMLGEGAARPEYSSVGGLELLCVRGPASEAFAKRLRAASSCLALFRVDEGALTPLMDVPPPPFADAAHILKYKGKTNELFTMLLLNVAVFSSAFADKYDTRLNIADPLCGRGTTLLSALSRGYDATGVDSSHKDLHEAVTFLKRYLEYHKHKHTVKHDKPQADGRTAGDRTTFVTAATPEQYKEAPLSIAFIHGDCAKLVPCVKRGSVHAIATDLPYGVQHAADGHGGRHASSLLDQCLPIWKEALRPGGAAALSFNEQTLPMREVRAALDRAGFEPLTGGAYDRMGHWVEQAVTRNIAVGIAL